MLVVVTEFMDRPALERFGDHVRVVYEPTLVDDRAATLAAVGEASAIIVRNRTQVDAQLLAAAPDLKVVGRLGVGLDNIDLDQCAQRGVAVCPATGANTRSVAEYVIATTMMLVRGAFQSNARMIAGEWPRGQLGTGGEVAGRRLGLFGFGAIAREVARLAGGLGLEVSAYDPHLPGDHPAWESVQRCPSDELLATSDVLSLHVPLTPETENLIDAQVIARMKAGAVLINTARGGIVDEEALVDALQTGRLAGAALDVFAQEPLSAERGRLFASAPNLILTPHVAGVTEEGNVRVSQLTVENVIRVLEGH